LARWDAARLDGLRPALARTLAEAGVPPAQLAGAAARAHEALARTLADPRGRWILADDHAEARAEQALSGVVDGRVVSVVLDRSFVDADGVRWIVDYKTSAHEGADRDAFLDRERERYRAQLERYARLVRALDPRPIRLGLYFPLLNGWREWEADR
jgi:ATP-dependent exoDNAse (exonuclease V) beta subunit